MTGNCFSFRAFILAILLPFSNGMANHLPNILWITSEDNGPELGCYGDAYATTPNIDALAARSLRYLNAWSNAPVCAPARTTIISGLYPPSLGAEHMRSLTSLPAGFKMYPQFLRDLGYYCTNNSKKDYNLVEPGQVWDESSNKAHWRNRKEGQPFFAIFNHTVSHESQIRKRPHMPVHDPKGVRLPAYHPDTPEIRQDWAQYYDKITEMDVLVGENLKELAEAGLAEDTIVFYYGDHGSGMPRSKRWPYDSGLHVPLLVHVPTKYQALAPADYRPGGTTDRLVSFVDLAPTMLSLVDIEVPDYMQGHAFMGARAADPQPYFYGFRGRMDERRDLVRAVGNGRYVYIRHYMPHKIYGQYLDYMFQTPTTRLWRALFDDGALNEVQSRFWQTKPSEELYDLQNDPDEIHNLSGSGEHQEILTELRAAHESWARRVLDIGLLPEHEIHRRSGKDAPYTMGHDSKRYAFDKIFATAQLASSLKSGVDDALLAACGDADSAVRYWGALGILMRGRPACEKHDDTLRALLKDPEVSPRMIAAEALGRYGEPADLAPAMTTLLEAADVEKYSLYAAIDALNGIDNLGGKAAPWKDEITKITPKVDGYDRRLQEYVPRLLERLKE